MTVGPLVMVMGGGCCLLLLCSQGPWGGVGGQLVTAEARALQVRARCQLSYRRSWCHSCRCRSRSLVAPVVDDGGVGGVGGRGD